MRKMNGSYTQYQPALSAANKAIPAIEINKSFAYLGKIFSANMDNEEAKSVVTDKLRTLLQTVSALKIKPQTKLKILRQVIYTRISF